MQRWSSFEEEELSSRYVHTYDMSLEEVRIEGVARAGMKFLFRWVLAMICVAYTGMILAITLIRGHISPIFLALLTMAMGFITLTLWVQTNLMARYWPQKKSPDAGSVSRISASCARYSLPRASRSRLGDSSRQRCTNSPGGRSQIR
jgi:hypothetical protein